MWGPRESPLVLRGSLMVLSQNTQAGCRQWGPSEREVVSGALHNQHPYGVSPESRTQLSFSICKTGAEVVITPTLCAGWTTGSVVLELPALSALIV